METPHGKLYLVPNTLDFGIDGPPASLDDTLAPAVIRLASRLEHWVVENAKSARIFLKRVDAIAPLARPLQELGIVEISRPAKGGPGKTGDAGRDIAALLAPALQGKDIGLLSEAGLPAVADPGAQVVQAAHARGIEVIALPGASALLLALAASGLNGQGFSFVGYLPIPAADRAARIRELELQSRRDGFTRIMIETPYRNRALFDALVEQLQVSTWLSVSCGLTLPAGFSRTQRVGAWRTTEVELPGNIPAVFSLHAGGTA
jgi:16S rRNA (cytidine1402-2'-O)-methyltransferase